MWQDTTRHGQVIEKASWRSGDAADCKSVYTGSIPVLASNKFNDLCILSFPRHH